MRRILIGLGVAAAIGGYLFSEYWYYLPGIISGVMDPVGNNRPVTWERGPDRSSGTLPPPNIVLIVADDLGFNDITFNGGGISQGSVPTPSIDSIATEGLQFTNGYAGNGTCAPSRAALLTGRFATRVGFEFTPATPQFAELVAGDNYIAENAVNYPPSQDLSLIHI